LDIPAVPFNPKLLRLALAKLIHQESAGRVAGLVMDPAYQRPEESDSDFFRRLELENRVESYIVIVPSRAKLLGTLFEGGMLIRDFHHGDHPRIAFYPESSMVKISMAGSVEFVEKGNRTRISSPWPGVRTIFRPGAPSMSCGRWYCSGRYSEAPSIDSEMTMRATAIAADRQEG
jgi:hypothetical protein